MFSEIASRLFGTVASKYEKSFDFLRINLTKADIKKPIGLYLSLGFFIVLLAFVSSLVFSIVLSLFVLNDIVMKILLPFLLPIIMPASCFVAVLYYPSFKANSRRKNIETNLPFVLTHMGSIAESGVPPYVIFRLIGAFEEYGEIAKEFKKIARNIDVYGIDPLSSVKSVAEKSPSETFKQTLLGFVTTTESGGNIKFYLKSSGEQALFDWRIKREKFLQQLSTYAEVYTGLMIAAPLFIISLFVVMGMIQPTLGGFNILDITRLSIYILVPVMNLGFLLFLRGVEVEI